MPDIFGTSQPQLTRLPHQRLCVLTSPCRAHISNHTLHRLQRISEHSTTKFYRPERALLQPSSMNCPTRSLSPGESMRSFGNLQLYICTTRIPKLLGCVGNLAKRMERWSLPSDRPGCHILDCSEVPSHALLTTSACPFSVPIYAILPFFVLVCGCLVVF